MNNESAIWIRPAQPGDGSHIYTFLCALEETQLDEPRFLGIFQRNLADPAIWYRVAGLQDQLVGFVSCHAQYLLHHAGRVGEIQELFVLPAHRNQKIGRQLLTHLEAIAREEAFVTLEVATNQRRSDAIRFYERAGFIASHRKLVMSF